MMYSDEQNISIGMIESTLMGHWKRASWQEKMVCKPSVKIYVHTHDKTHMYFEMFDMNDRCINAKTQTAWRLLGLST